MQFFPATRVTYSITQAIDNTSSHTHNWKLNINILLNRIDCIDKTKRDCDDDGDG